MKNIIFSLLLVGLVASPVVVGAQNVDRPSVAPDRIDAQTENLEQIERERTQRQAPINDVACTMQYDPVCGVDGRTYGNACVATSQNGVDIAYEGECNPTDSENERDRDQERERETEREEGYETPRAVRQIGETIGNIFQRINPSNSFREGNLRDLSPEDRREFIQETRETFLEKAEEARNTFQEKLSVVQDDRQKEIAERINNNLLEIKQRLLDRFLTNLDKIEAVLLRASERADELEENGVDVSEIREEIELTESTISDAREEVTSQFEETYEIVFEDETGLGTAMRVARDTLYENLSNARALVQEAHEETRSVATMLSQLSDDILQDEDEIEDETEVEEESEIEVEESDN